MLFLACEKSFPTAIVEKLRKSDRLQVFIKLVQGKTGIDVVFLTRLTPLPGIQSAVTTLSNFKKGLLCIGTGLLIGGSFWLLEGSADVEKTLSNGYAYYFLGVSISVFALACVIRRRAKMEAQRRKGLTMSTCKLFEEDEDVERLLAECVDDGATMNGVLRLSDGEEHSLV
eukprot:Colp12_sorted_trinity150504_noHs@36145